MHPEQRTHLAIHAALVGAVEHVADGEATVTDGPFAEAKEVIGGYAIYQAHSLDDLRPWSERFGRAIGTGTSEIRPVYGAEDFGEAFTPELQAQEERLRAEGAARSQSAA